MATLYPDELQTIDDYKRLVPRLHHVMAPHLTDILYAGLSVVLDFPANTIIGRAWMRSIFEAADAGHLLHVLDTPEEICWARLQARNAQGGASNAGNPIDIASLIVLAIAGKIGTPELIKSLLLAPPLLIGVWLGSQMFHRGGERFYRPIAIAILAGVAAGSLLF